jgi:hypothetical protein
MEKALRKIVNQLTPKSIERIRWRKFLQSKELALSAIGTVDEEWQCRIESVLSSPDNVHIDRVANAGKIIDHYIVMHNGVKVCVNSYYGAGIANMLVANRGVHEPQEEKAFTEVVKLMPHKCRMLELGAYWGFYSLSLLNERTEAECFLVEPESFNLLCGEVNFELNRREGKFIQAAIGATHVPRKIVSVDGLMQEHSIPHLDILHADIQGFELDMLEGAKEALFNGCVDYVFISTHSNVLHRSCLEFLENYEYKILAEADLNETFSYDGVIVARRGSHPGPDIIEISKRSG